MVDLEFIVTTAVAVGGAIFALEAKEIVYGAMGLAASLLGVAIFFFILQAPYVAAFQITVYVGAIAVLILFTVMLVRQESWAREIPTLPATRASGIVTGLAITLAISIAVVVDDLSKLGSVANTQGFVGIGDLISTTYAPVLEVLAVVLAASVVGALTLSKVEKEEPAK